MTFEWDEEKEQINIAKHGIDFVTASHVFLDPDRLEIFDEKHNTKEFLDDRKITFGENTLIESLGGVVIDSLVERYSDDLTREQVEEFIESTFNDNDLSKYILEYVTYILIERYGMNLDRIRI